MSLEGLVILSREVFEYCMNDLIQAEEARITLVFKNAQDGGGGSCTQDWLRIMQRLRPPLCSSPLSSSSSSSFANTINRLDVLPLGILFLSLIVRTRWTDHLEKYASGGWKETARDEGLWKINEEGYVLHEYLE